MKCNVLYNVVYNCSNGVSNKWLKFTNWSNCRIPGPLIYMCRCALKNEVYHTSISIKDAYVLASEDSHDISISISIRISKRCVLLVLMLMFMSL